MISIQNHLRNEGLLNLFDRAASKVERQMLALAAASVSGTTVDFTTLPATKRITIHFHGVSALEAGEVRLGGGVESSGYIVDAPET